MDNFFILEIIGVVILFICIAGYSATTNKIIKDQDREIEKLTDENKRLREDLKKAVKVTNIVINPDKPDPKVRSVLLKKSNIPSFKEW